MCEALRTEREICSDVGKGGRVSLAKISASLAGLSAQIANADLYYRHAVLELKIPSVEERGGVDKIAICKAFIADNVGGERLAALPDLAYWCGRGDRYPLPRNVRELRNLAERIGVTVRQIGAWDAARLQRLVALARPTQPVPAIGVARIPRSIWAMAVTFC